MEVISFPTIFMDGKPVLELWIKVHGATGKKSKIDVKKLTDIFEKLELSDGYEITEFKQSHLSTRAKIVCKDIYTSYLFQKYAIMHRLFIKVTANGVEKPRYMKIAPYKQKSIVVQRGYSRHWKCNLPTLPVEVGNLIVQYLSTEDTWSLVMSGLESSIFKEPLKKPLRIVSRDQLCHIKHKFYQFSSLKIDIEMSETEVLDLLEYRRSIGDRKPIIGIDFTKIQLSIKIINKILAWFRLKEFSNRSGDPLTFKIPELLQDIELYKLHHYHHSNVQLPSVKKLRIASFHECKCINGNNLVDFIMAQSNLEKLEINKCIMFWTNKNESINNCSKLLMDL